MEQCSNISTLTLPIDTYYIYIVDAGLIILLTKKSAASLRYNLLAGCLSLFLVLSISTFIYEMTINDQGSEKDALQQTANSLTISVIENQQDTIQSSGQTENFFGYFSNYLNEHAAFVVLIWFLFFLAKSIQLSSNCCYSTEKKSKRKSKAK